MGIPRRTAASLPSHDRKVAVSVRALDLQPLIEMPPPPPGMSTAAVAVWCQLAEWAEHNLLESALGVFECYCNAVGDLQMARATWAGLGHPLTVSRTVGPHQGVGAHPLPALIDRLVKQVARLAQALGLLPAEGRRQQAAVQTAPVSDDDEAAVDWLRSTPAGRNISDRFFNGH